MLEAEKLGDPPREMALDLGERSVGIHHAPDRLDELQPLFPREVIGEETRELKQVDAAPPFFLGEAQNVPEVGIGDPHFVADMTGNPLPLLGTKGVIGMRDLEKQRAGRHDDGIGTSRFALTRRFPRQKSPDGLDSHAASLAGG